MTQEKIYQAIKSALSSYYTNYHDWDDLHVYYCGGRLHIGFNIFTPWICSRIESYMAKHNIPYNKRNGVRGGYLGGGEYRTFTAYCITIDYKKVALRFGNKNCSNCKHLDGRKERYCNYQQYTMSLAPTDNTCLCFEPIIN